MVVFNFYILIIDIVSLPVGDKSNSLYVLHQSCNLILYKTLPKGHKLLQFVVAQIFMLCLVLDGVICKLIP